MEDLAGQNDKELNALYSAINQSKNKKPELIREAKTRIEELKASFDKRKNVLEGEINKRRWRKQFVGILTAYFVGKRALGEAQRIFQPSD